MKAQTTDEIELVLIGADLERILCPVGETTLAMEWWAKMPRQMRHIFRWSIHMGKKAGFVDTRGETLSKPRCKIPSDHDGRF